MAMDRPGIAGCALLCLLIQAVPFAQGQEQSNSIHLEDAQQDVTSSGAPNPIDFVDLTGITITATTEGLDLAIQVRSTQLIAVYLDQAFGSGIDVVLGYRDESFTTSFVIRSVDQVDVQVRRGLDRTFTSATAFANNALNVQIPWSALQSGTGFTPSAGELIVLKSVASFIDLGKASSTQQGTTPIYGRDEIVVPDSTSLTIPGNTGTLRLSSQRPVLSANGEEAVHSWSLELVDTSGKDRDVAIRLDPADATSVDYPATVQVNANGNATFRITALFPFAHQHGGSRTLTVHATEGPDELRYALQVYYIQPPQPAGHHNSLFVHVFGDDNPNNFDAVSMNTTNQPVNEIPAGAGGRNCQGDNRAAYTWVIPLDPTLEVGIDARLGETIHFTGTIHQALPAIPVDLRARLALGENGRTPELALDDEFTMVSPWTDSPNQDVVVNLDIPLPTEFDYAEPRPGLNLFFLLSLCSTTPEPAAGLGQLAALPAGEVFQLQSGAYLALPFNDFRPLEPPITNGLSMIVDERFKAYPPGSDAIWNVTLNQADKLQLDILAPDEYQAKVQTRSPTGFSVTMTVPEGSLNGRLLDFVIVATEGQSKGELRLGVYVDTQAPHYTYSAPTAKQATPGLELGILIVALAIISKRRPPAN